MNKEGEKKNNNLPRFSFPAKPLCAIETYLSIWFAHSGSVDMHRLEVVMQIGRVIIVYYGIIRRLVFHAPFATTTTTIKKTVMGASLCGCEWRGLAKHNDEIISW